MDKKFVIRISEQHYGPTEGEAVIDIAWKREHYPTHKEVENLITSHFSDWNVQVIPL